MKKAMKNVVLTICITLVYIGLLTVIFEYFINEASSTLLTASGLLLILILSTAFLYYLLRRFKNPIQ